MFYREIISHHPDGNNITIKRWYYDSDFTEKEKQDFYRYAKQKALEKFGDLPITEISSLKIDRQSVFAQGHSWTFSRS